jgi:N-acetylmuramoyl-L-alanine amidase
MLNRRVTPDAGRILFCLLCSVFVVSCRSSQAGREVPPGVEPNKPVEEQGQLLAQAREQSPLRIVYPAENAVIPAPSTFIAGNIPQGARLTLKVDQGDELDVRVNARGYFAQAFPLTPGQHTITAAIPGTAYRKELHITRELPPQPISADVLKIAGETAQPKEDRGLTTGDIIEFSVKATPASYVEVQLAKRTIILRSPSSLARARGRSKHHSGQAVNPNVNLGTDAAFGKIYQRRSGSPPDLYLGFYKVAPDDHFASVHPKFALFKGGKSKTFVSDAAITVVSQPTLAQTRHSNTIVRLGPGKARTTPADEGVRFMVDGWQADQLRCLLAGGHHVWIAREDLVYEAESGESGPAPRSVARTLNLLEGDNYGPQLIVPLSQKLPYQVEQLMNPSRLVLRVFGATADIDWVTPILNPGNGSDLIDHATWRQAADDILEITLHLKPHRQWGFKVDYEDTKLRLHVKRPPQIQSANGAAPLRGLSICIDPGHGGKERGATGCSGIAEADVNLGISMKLKRLLEQDGARVVMTRTTDTDVSLDERVRIAGDADVDILLSVHNNALPDGADPQKEHGTSSYWYHPQAIELARSLKLAMVNEINFPDFGTRWQNLALTRPSAMLSTLAEVGFMINPDEIAVLEQPEGQARAAMGLRKGLIEYLNAGN